MIDNEKLRYDLPEFKLDNSTNLNYLDLKFEIPDTTFLEVLLLKIRGETIRYASNKKKISCKKEQDLKREIEKLESNEKGLTSVMLESKKIELESLRKEKMTGIMIRSRAQWISEGEKPSKFFCSLEKNFYTEKTVKKIITNSGSILTEQKPILSEIKNFNEDLFRNKDSDLGQYNLNSMKALKD